MKLTRLLLEWIAGRMKIPADAVRMFKAANQVSGIDKETLPSELIPLNTLQLARGLLNFTILQNSPQWVLPFWAERQYNPRSPAFIPRSHLGLSMNITHRNWTAVGLPGCDVEPIIDPRGLVTPFRNGWSLDVWLSTGTTVHFPSRAERVQQRLVDNLPIVETSFTVNDISLRTTSYGAEDRAVVSVRVANTGSGPTVCRLGFAVRPFNPEGISLVHDIEVNSFPSSFLIDNRHPVFLSEKPDMVHCSTYERGDCARTFPNLVQGDEQATVHCSLGLATGMALYDLTLPTGSSRTIEALVPLTEAARTVQPAPKIPAPTSEWNALLAKGITITTPDAHLTGLIKSSTATLLLLVDGNTITPGPSTYHQFWFRDAVYMLWALDRAGFSQYTRPILLHFTDYQLSSGYFRSQQGEWDSNGQVLWAVWQHFLLNGNRELLSGMFPSLHRASRWILKKLLLEKHHEEQPWYGLLPQGLSAEHLGLADHYFWDNFWSVAGLQTFINMCTTLGRSSEGEEVGAGLKQYQDNIERALRRAEERTGFGGIPAGPTREVDCGMIGSLCALYPLQYVTGDDRRLLTTLEALMDRYMLNGMFFQHVIHSGMNAYLTLHIAHAWLYAGDRQRFWQTFMAVVSHATSTNTYPEAIHPLTGGGSMGDGHHGWASAEVLLAARDMFVYERKADNGHPATIVLLGGIPVEWFRQGKKFSVRNAPIVGGVIDLEVTPDEGRVEISITFQPRRHAPETRWLLILPPILRDLSATDIGLLVPSMTPTAVEYSLEPHSIRLTGRLR